ncbi:MAG: AAA family ATPase [Paludibacteraceae bacterium]|nr:AAA family ATPase [Paludibacteraceae bacterium]
MLAKFAVKNFRGFAERIEWDLSNPSNYSFNTYAVKNDIVHNGIIYGPNGSGKTNFSIALFDIVNHLTQKAKKPDYYQNFVYGGKTNLIVDFEYTFKFGTQIVSYNYSKNASGVLLKESLFVNNSEVFNRNNDSLSLDEKQFPINKDAKQNLQMNANHISIVNYLLTSYPLSKDHFLIRLRDFVNSMLWFRCLKVNEYMGFDNTSTMLDEYIIQNGLVNDFSNFLMNVSGQKFNFVPTKSTDKILLCKIDNGVVAFDLIASTGTQSLMLLYFWLKKMGAASFVFIDEFDAFYHFKLAFEVCKQLFNLPCQVFTSSHNTYLMTNDLLRPDCNFILQDNKIKPLQACTDKELRFGHNIEKLFRGGAFEI